MDILDLSSVIGRERLAPYEIACDGDVRRALRLYTWNIEASSALLGAFAPLEVGIRNAMDRSLTHHFERADWWSVAPLTRADTDEIGHATDYLDRRRGSAGWTPGHLVAELKISFWEGLLVNRYHAALWNTALEAAFPHAVVRRSEIRARLERLRLLRNRAAHHEPIHARDLSIDHRFMCELAGFISPHLEAWIASHSRLPSTIAHRERAIDGARRGRF